MLVTVFIVTPSVVIPLCHSQGLCSFSLPLGLCTCTLSILLANPSGADCSGISVGTPCRHLGCFKVGSLPSSFHFSHNPFFPLWSPFTSFYRALLYPLNPFWTVCSVMSARISSLIYLLRYVVSIYLDSIINKPDLDLSFQTLT